jgi:hypothetical protein
MEACGVTAGCLGAVRGDAATPNGLELTDREAWLGGPLAVDDLATAAVSAALLAAAELADARGAGRPHVRLSAEHVALSFVSERHALRDGRAIGAGFAPLSRFVRCADGGWARTHANYPRHAAALGRALGIEAGKDPEAAVAALQTAAGTLDAVVLEQRIVAAGGCAAALRTPAQWSAHPAGSAVARAPLVCWEDALAGVSSHPLGPGATRTRPASGLRVLDLTRVIAGPVAARTLAALGAEVLRIDPPRLPELPAQHLDTGPGKRSALLDLADAARREELLGGADVLLVGYRSNSLDRFGMSSEQLASRHPQLVQVWLSAWGRPGPWATRRGFDSLVQVASGIAAVTASDDGTPGVLPAQALDHATGHLMAAAALRGLTARARNQPIPPARLSLARTAKELLDAPRPARVTTRATGAADPAPHRVTFGRVSLIAPPGELDGVPLRWTHGPHPLGADVPAWC